MGSNLKSQPPSKLIMDFSIVKSKTLSYIYICLKIVHLTTIDDNNKL